MREIKRERYNPMELIKQWFPDADISHITYNPDMKPSDRQYWRMESGVGDGTFIFTIEMMQKCLLPILNRESIFLAEEPEDWSKVKDIKYTIGRMSYVARCGMVYLTCSNGKKYPGQLERVRIPVKCEYL